MRTAVIDRRCCYAEPFENARTAADMSASKFHRILGWMLGRITCQILIPAHVAFEITLEVDGESGPCIAGEILEESFGVGREVVLHV